MDTTLLRSISKLYNWEDAEIIPVNSGLINNTWQVIVEGHTYLLQSVNTNVFANPAGIDDNCNRLAVHLRNVAPDYLFTAPVKNTEGASLVEKEGKFYRVFEWVKGSHTVDVVNTADQAYEAAQAFGLFTALLKRFDAATLHISLPGFHDLSLRFRQFEAALNDGNNKRINAAKDLIKYLLSNKSLVAKYEAFIHHQEVKQRVTHHDTKISNVLFDEKNKGLCVIDLDTVMPGYFLSDVGDMLRTYVCPVSEEESDLDKIFIRKEYIEAIQEGYLSHMKHELSSFERDHFYFSGSMLIYMQALRFLTDHIQNDTYYGARYTGHNEVRAANQARLLALFHEAGK